MACEVNPIQQNPLPGREKADYLAVQIGRRLNVRNAHLDTSGDRSFGEFGVHYWADRDVVSLRFFVAKARISDNTPERVEATRKTARALNDPKIGGMFDQGGAHFELDEGREMFFLVKDFPLVTATPEDLWASATAMRELAAIWSIRWFFHAAGMAHGFEPLPKQRIDRDHDPYKQ